MSQRLINLNHDLKRLRDEGYDLSIISGHLLIKQVPYVNSKKEVMYGVLVSNLSLAGDITIKPEPHVVHFAGDYPCDKDGNELSQIRHQSAVLTIVPGQVVHHSFSSKPTGGYLDYYAKMTTYIAILSSPARSLDPRTTATPFPVYEPDEAETVFLYEDTASSRAGISNVTKKLELSRIAIVGLGGTGSFILDLVAKTPVKEIHLFDGDVFSQHNAFRSPGAPSIETLRQAPKKVDYFKEIYSQMRRGIITHDYFVNESTVSNLREMDFVFLCMDGSEAKRYIVKELEEFGVSFIDVGMGINLVDDSLHGILRVTSSISKRRRHVWDKHRIPFTDGYVDNEYTHNIQIADLNALNASLAVIKWKKLYEFYKDYDQEFHSTFTIDGNMLINEDRP